MKKSIDLSNKLKNYAILFLIFAITFEFVAPGEATILINNEPMKIPLHIGFFSNISIGIFCSIAVVYLNELFNYELEKRKAINEIEQKMRYAKSFLKEVTGLTDARNYKDLALEYRPFFSDASELSRLFYPKENDCNKKEYFDKIMTIEPYIYIDFLTSYQIQRINNEANGYSEQLNELLKEKEKNPGDPSVTIPLASCRKSVLNHQKNCLPILIKQAQEHLNKIEKVEKEYDHHTNL